MKCLRCGVGLFLILLTLSCEPRIVLHRLNPDDFKPNMYGLKYYVKDTALVKYLGTWSGEQFSITFTNTFNRTDPDGQYKWQLIEGMITYHQNIDGQQERTFQLPVNGASFLDRTLTVYGKEHDMHARLYLDSLSQDDMLWRNEPTERWRFYDIVDGKKYVDGKELLEDLEFPKELRLKRVKQ